MAILTVRAAEMDPMKARATRFAEALHITTNKASWTLSAPFFRSSPVVRSGEYEVRQKRAEERRPPLLLFAEIEVVGSNKQVIAIGSVQEYAKCELAREGMLRRIVMNSMPLEMVIGRYESYNSDIGDMCIVTKDSQSILFIRGSTAVELFSADKTQNPRVVARAIDRNIVNADDVRNGQNK